MSVDGQGTKHRRKIAENFNRLSRAHRRYRQASDRQTDGTSTAYSECEREFTFAKNETAEHYERKQSQVNSRDSRFLLELSKQDKKMQGYRKLFAIFNQCLTVYRNQWKTATTYNTIGAM